MSRRLDDLQPDFKKKVFELLARCVEQGILVKIIDTLRTSDEQAKNIQRGVSWTKNSKHLTGLAIDLCPIRSYRGRGTTKLNWDDVNPEWTIIGKIGESLGMTWGGRWKVRDMGHLEYPGV